MLPEPTFQPPQKSSDGKLTDSERVAQRIAIKQAFLSSLGLEWEPDDQAVQKEYMFLPADGSIVELPTFEMPERPPAEEDKSAFDFVPTEDDSGTLTDEEYEMIMEARRAKKNAQSVAGNSLDNYINKPTPAPAPLQPTPQPPMQPAPVSEVIGIAGNSLNNYINKPTPSPLQPQPQAPTQPVIPQEVIGVASNSLNNYINKPTPTPGPFPMSSPTPVPKPVMPGETTGTDEGAIV